ncbi:BlaI/MecI/CopY family transcriptional regulator [Anaerovorax sp. IOR16]|uniref:BlaI/MecI/CopY family transcriptional regulator n=1 Tax=Anaerovorax sp. IOR16 TaxID=2773458 RepID=UPI0019D29D96|nr:BlaI/MecI/CopY family transcriptional regulator [Anaerovorax sp. IOR16]
MSDYKLFESEYKFMELIWEHSPVNSTKLVKLCTEELGWKKSTTYTVLRKLCERGITKNVDATVTYMVPREEIQMQESKAFLEKTFDGSLPMFLASFLKKESLSKQEIKELRRIIDESANETEV